MNPVNIDRLLDNDQLTFQQEMQIRKLIKYKIYRLANSYIFQFTIGKEFNENTDRSVLGKSVRELKSKKKDIIYELIGMNLPFIKGSSLINSKIVDLIKADNLVKSAGGYSAQLSKGVMPAPEKMKITTLFEILMTIATVKQQVAAIRATQS